MDLTKRADEMPPFIVMDVMERSVALEQEGRSIIHLEIGAPDFDSPRAAKDAAIRALNEGKTAYTHSLGLSELRQAIAGHYWADYRAEVRMEQVVVTSGTSPAFFLILSALIEPGDEVILTNPCYACYPNYVRFVGGRAVQLDVLEKDGFAYRPEALRAAVTPRTKAIMINSPGNPTGQLIAEETLKEIAEIAASAGVYLISDEIYHGLVYEGRARSALEFTDRAFVLNGFSKLYAMPGWRLGYLVAPEEYVRPIQRMQQNLFLCASSFGQWGALTALTECGADLERMRREYDRRRRYLIPELQRLGFGIAVPPTGAFYVFANAQRFGADSLRLAHDILEQTGVALAPGIDFGSGGEGYLRFCYANTLDNLEQAVSRLDSYLNRS